MLLLLIVSVVYHENYAEYKFVIQIPVECPGKLDALNNAVTASPCLLAIGLKVFNAREFPSNVTTKRS